MKEFIKAVTIVTLLLVIACEEDAEITSGIEGQWRGTLAEVQFKPFGLPIPVKDDDPSFATRIDFNKGGALVIQEDGQKQGTYAVNGDELDIEIDYTIEDINLSGKYHIETLTATQLVIHTKRDETIADPDGGPSVSGEIKITLHFDRL